VGGLRSALFNWLWARHTDGKFVLRIEDTDRARLVDDALEQINDSLEALGVEPDEGPRQGGEYGPYLQSERLDIYRNHADQLLESEKLYRCWCTPKRLAGLREQAHKAGVAFKYDRHCLVRANRRSEAEPHVLRFHIPRDPASVSWTDAVRGRLSFKTADLEDFVAVKADGYPTYQFANVVDDHLMDITHVLRADEWIPSTPKHILLYRAFGWDTPTFAHLPAVLGPTGGKKLSKRDGAKSVAEYLAEGYLPEALMSFLATLGWNDGTTQEVFTPLELIEKFTLERIQKSPAKFDAERLTWVNGVVIRGLTLPELLERTRSFWPSEASNYDDPYKREVLRLVHERLKLLSELPELTEFFFTDPQASVVPDASSPLVAVHDALEKVEDWQEESVEKAVRPLVETLGMKPGQLFGLIRLALTGRTAAPGLFETMAVLGRETTLRRLNEAAT
jgi:glutamyl-tRNA synthetase